MGVGHLKDSFIPLPATEYVGELGLWQESLPIPHEPSYKFDLASNADALDRKPTETLRPLTATNISSGSIRKKAPSSHKSSTT